MSYHIKTCQPLRQRCWSCYRFTCYELPLRSGPFYYHHFFNKNVTNLPEYLLLIVVRVGLEPTCPTRDATKGEWWSTRNGNFHPSRILLSTGGTPALHYATWLNILQLHLTRLLRRGWTIHHNLCLRLFVYVAKRPHLVCCSYGKHSRYFSSQGEIRTHIHFRYYLLDCILR